VQLNNMAHNNGDVENSASGERTPMLGRSSHQHISKDDNKWYFMHIMHFFGGGIYAPNPSTYDPIKILLNTEDAEKKDELTTRWRDNKLSELSFVGVVVCL
jgi:hypothetical protein